jgi:hypothetical protein
VNQTTAVFNYQFNIVDPTTGNIQAIDDTALPSNQIRLFVGAQSLPGTVLGEGTPGGFGVTTIGTVQNQSDLVTAVQNASAAGTANMLRGGGPVIGSISGSLDAVPYTIEYGSNVGSIWFNSNINWQYNNTLPVAAGQYDLYSAALQEIVDALGFASSASWDAEVTGADSRSWRGTQVMRQLGYGTDILAPDSTHIAQGVLSPNLTAGLRQLAVMEPNLSAGTRDSLTLLDLAFLRDIGWQTIDNNIVPGDFNRDLSRTAADIPAMMRALTNLTAYQTQNGLSNTALLSIGDLNGDGQISNSDLQSLLQLLIDPAAASGSLSQVPEPRTLQLALIGIGLLSIGRWHSKGRRPPLVASRTATATAFASK